LFGTVIAGGAGYGRWRKKRKAATIAAWRLSPPDQTTDRISERPPRGGLSVCEAAWL